MAKNQNAETPNTDTADGAVTQPQPVADDKQKHFSELPAPVQQFITGLNETIQTHNQLVARLKASDPKDIESALDGLVETQPELKEISEQISQAKDLLAELVTAARESAMQYLPTAMNDEEKTAAQVEIKTLRTRAADTAKTVEHFPLMFSTMGAKDVERIHTDHIIDLMTNGRARNASSINTDGPKSIRPRTAHVTINGNRVNGPAKLDEDKKPLLEKTGETDENGADIMQPVTRSTFTDASTYVNKNHGVSIATSEFPQLFLVAHNAADWDALPESSTIHHTFKNKSGDDVELEIGYTKAN